MQIREWMKRLEWEGLHRTHIKEDLQALGASAAGWLRAIPGPSAALAPRSLGLVPVASPS